MKGLQRSLSRAPNAGAQLAIKTLRGAISATVTIEGTTGVGYGTTVITDLPEGNLKIVGAVFNLASMTRVGTNIAELFNGDVGVGTTPLDDGTITAGDVDLIASTALVQAVGGATPATRLATAAANEIIYDNTANTLEVNLNILIDDADISDDDGLTVIGDFAISYIVLGDD